MAWHDVDFVLTESMEFSTDANRQVLPVFKSSTEKLDDEWQQYRKRFQELVGKPEKDEDAYFAYQEMDWEEGLHRDRLRALGSLALDWLMSSLKKTLRSAKRYLNDIRPAKEPYAGDGWLAKEWHEYSVRFGIEFRHAPAPFERIEELVLARNAGIHREEEGGMDEYLAKVQRPRFVDDKAQFFVTEDALRATIADAIRFVEWVIAELRKIRADQAV